MRDLNTGKTFGGPRSLAHQRGRSLRLLALSSALALATGCVSTHEGKVVKPVAQPFQVSCSNNQDVDAKPFVAVTCTFENTSDQWIDLAVREIRFPRRGFEATVDGKKTILPVGVRLLSPAETASFVESYGYKQAKEDANAALFLSALAFAGAAASASNSTAASATGAGVAAGALASGAAAGLGSRANAAQNAPLGYGPEHVLYGPFKVPPRMFTRRSFLLETATGIAVVDALGQGFTMVFANPEGLQVQVPFVLR